MSIGNTASCIVMDRVASVIKKEDPDCCRKLVPVCINLLKIHKFLEQSSRRTKVLQITVGVVADHYE